jgi:hypothetical protein
MGMSNIYFFEVQNVKSDPSTHVHLIKKVIYGLVQAARKWWKWCKEVMATCDYYPSKSNPCLFIKKAADGVPILIVIIYVDEGGIIGTPDAIKEAIAAQGKGF